MFNNQLCIERAFEVYTTGLLDNPLILCYNDDSEGENFTDY